MEGFYIIILPMCASWSFICLSGLVRAHNHKSLSKISGSHSSGERIRAVSLPLHFWESKLCRWDMAAPDLSLPALPLEINSLSIWKIDRWFDPIPVPELVC